MARESIGSLHLQFKANVRGFVVPLREMRRAVGAVDKDVQKSGRSWKKLAVSVLGAVAAYKAFKLAARGILGSIKTAAEFERQGAALEALIGNARIAKNLQKDLIGFSLATPFTFKELLDASKQLLAFGFTAKEILPTLAVLGEAAAATGTSLSEAVFPFAQSRTEFKQVWKDIRQFTSRGILSLEDLAAVLNTTRDKIRDLSEAGKLNFNQIAEAMKRNAIEGGRFHGMMGKIAETTYGLIQRFKDLGILIKRDIGAAFIEVTNLRGIMKGLFETVGEIVTAGLFRTAMETWMEHVRTVFLWLIGQIEQTIRMSLRAIGKAITELAKLFGEIGAALAKIPIIGEPFRSKRTISIRQNVLGGETENEFLNRVQRRRDAILDAGGEILNQKIGLGLIAPGFVAKFDIDEASPFKGIVDAAEKFGKSLNDTSTYPDFAKWLEERLNPKGQSVVTQSVSEIWKTLTDHWKTFFEDVKTIGAGGELGLFISTVRDWLGDLNKTLTTGVPLFDRIIKHYIESGERMMGAAQKWAATSTFSKVLSAPIKFIADLAGSFKSGFDETELFFGKIGELLDKAATQIKGIEGPRRTLRERVDEQIAQSSLAKSPAFEAAVVIARARADELDHSRLVLEEQKNLWELSQKIIEDTVTPMQKLNRLAVDTIVAQHKGYMTEKQRLAGLRKAAKELFNIADVKIDPFETFTLRAMKLKELFMIGRISFEEFEHNLRLARDKRFGDAGGFTVPFSQYEFADPTFKGRIRGADMSSLLAKQSKNQQTLVDRMLDVVKILKSIDRDGVQLKQNRKGRVHITGGI